jgi:probable phosphoglycerate mutase
MSGLVFLARHAQPDRSRTDLDYHLPPGPPLTPLGLEQAAALAEFFFSHGVCHVYTSPLERCLHTAQIVAGRLHVTPLVEQGLAERLVGETPQRQSARMWPVFEASWQQSLSSGPVALITHGGPALVLLLDLGLTEAEARFYTSQYDYQNVMSTAGAWEITQLNGAWQCRMVFTPGVA